jgi:transposase, IS30 family
MGGQRPALRPERVVFWEAVRAGMSSALAGRAAGVSSVTAWRWVNQAGGVISIGPRPERGRYLSVAECGDIAVGRAAGQTMTAIAVALGRPCSMVSRELRRNTSRAGWYRASVAQGRADDRARRPKASRLAVNTALRGEVAARLGKKWPPAQIAATLKNDFPGQAEMHVPHETIYQALYVQGRGALRRGLAVCLRTGRGRRRPRRQAAARRHRAGPFPGSVMISQRPAEAGDRAVPGHREGDLIIGKNSGSAIGTLVERTTRYWLLLHLPSGRDAAAVRDEMITTIAALPAMLRRSMTWDQGREMAQHAQITLAAGLDIYFCGPHSPWQRGSSENTNGLLRQYFPKGTSLAGHTRGHLDAVAPELNDRPRKTLGWRSPAQALGQLLLSRQDPVATTD